MMKKGGVGSFVALWAVLMVVVLAAAGLQKTAAADKICKPWKLLEKCLPAFFGAEEPTLECCDQVKAQSPCLCEYRRHPSTTRYFNSPNADKLVRACHVGPRLCIF
ncbi:hypothetical protein ABFX02_12G029200 [Erythranthe guttata]